MPVNVPHRPTERFRHRLRAFYRAGGGNDDSADARLRNDPGIVTDFRKVL